MQELSAALQARHLKAPLADGIGNGNLVDTGVIGDDGVGIRLPRYVCRSEQLGAIGAGERGCIKRASCEERDRADGLIEIVDQIDLGTIGAGGVGVGKSRSVGDGIDGDALGGLGQAAKDQIGTAEENLSGGSGGDSDCAAGGGIQNISEARVADGSDVVDAVKIRGRAIPSGAGPWHAGDQDRSGISGRQKSRRVGGRGVRRGDGDNPRGGQCESV